MTSLFPLIASAVVTVVAWVLVFLWIWGLHRQWWRIRAVRRALLLAPATILLIDLIGVVLVRSHVALPIWTAYLLIALVVAWLGLAVTLPISGLVLTGERIAGWARRRRRGAPATPSRSTSESTLPAADAARAAHEGARGGDRREHVDRGRRSMLVKVAAVVPAATVLATTTGIADSGEDALVPTIPFTFKRLPPELDGLRILHLSDIHLGPFVDLDYLERTLERGARGRPDLVLVTGDVADDLKALPDALRMIDQLRPRYGTYASIGNHEYYRGIRTVLESFDRGPIPLLRDSGMAVPIGGTTLYLGGADDPAHSGDGGRKPDPGDLFLRRTVERAFDGAPSEGFHLLMSHRPRGFVPASALGIPMTISGHTHGGIQFGVAGRSPLDLFLPEQYLWGHYRRGDAQLYTSAGVGHWLPFRLGCPREAPIYVLRRG